MCRSAGCRFAPCLCAFLIAALLCPAVVLSAKRSNPAKRQVPASGVPAADQAKAAELVTSALAQALAGNDAQRAAYLQQALDKDESNPAAHWHLGEVLVGDRWLTIDEAMILQAKSPAVYEYRNRRLQIDDSTRAHLVLAEWCRAVGLPEQQRAHLLVALSREPKNQALRRQLDLEGSAGQLLTKQQRHRQKEARIAATLAARRWSQQINPLRERLASGAGQDYESAREQVLCIEAPAAIVVLEKVLSTASESAALVVVEALLQIPQQEASSKRP